MLCFGGLSFFCCGIKVPEIKKEKNLSSASQVIRRGQDSNLQSSGHEPDELTNYSTPLLPLILILLGPSFVVVIIAHHFAEEMYGMRQ